MIFPKKQPISRKKLYFLKKVFLPQRTQRNRKVRKYKDVKTNSLRSLRKPFVNFAVKNNQ